MALRLAPHTEMVDMLLVNKSRGVTLDVGAVNRIKLHYYAANKGGAGSPEPGSGP